MNNLSWLIYAIGVTDALREMAIAFLIIGGIGGVIGMVLLPMALDLFDTNVGVKEVFRAIRKWAVPTAIICCLIVILAPSRQTLLLIAGSEIGQRVIAAPSAQSVIEPGADLLRTWIAEETRKLKSKADR